MKDFFSKIVFKNSKLNFSEWNDLEIDKIRNDHWIAKVKGNVFYSSVFLEVEVKSVSRVWLCDPMGCSPIGSSVHGIFQTRVISLFEESTFQELLGISERTSFSA